MHNVNGIIPKVKINYFEVAMLTGGTASKDYCRDEVEYTCARYANQVRAGQNLSVKIPHVGTLKIRDGLCGVIFDQPLIDACKGKTAKNYKYTFTGNNWVNNKIYEPNRTNYQGMGSSSLTFDKSLFSPDNVKLTKGASRWLKQNLALDADNLDSLNAGPGRLFSPQATNPRKTQELRNTPRMDPMANILSGRNSEKREEEIKSMKALLEE